MREPNVGTPGLPGSTRLADPTMPTMYKAFTSNSIAPAGPEMSVWIFATGTEAGSRFKVFSAISRSFGVTKARIPVCSPRLASQWWRPWAKFL